MHLAVLCEAPGVYTVACFAAALSDLEVALVPTEPFGQSRTQRCRPGDIPDRQPLGPGGDAVGPEPVAHNVGAQAGC